MTVNRVEKKPEVIEVDETISKPADVLTVETGPSTVPKDPMSVPRQPPNVSSSAPQTGKGQVNLGPPVVGKGPYSADPITGFGVAKEPPPAGAKPYTDKAK